MLHGMNPNAPVFVPQGLQPGPQPNVQAQPQVGGPAMAVPIAVAQVPVVLNIGYANNFDQKHTVPALDGTNAVRVGYARDVNGAYLRYSTVFRQDYLEGVVLAAAAGKGAGNHELVVNCHALSADKFELAEYKKQKWTRVPPTMFFCKVVYSVGGGTVTLRHIETG